MKSKRNVIEIIKFDFNIMADRKYKYIESRFLNIEFFMENFAICYRFELSSNPQCERLKSTD